MRHNARKPQKNNGGGNRHHKKPSGRMKVYDSNGPDARIRGTAWQVTEKYETLAKDAEISGNFVLAENYRQHGEHYQRIINAFEEANPVNVSNDKNVTNNSHNANNNQTQKPHAQNTNAKPKSEDDLGLPASIVGEAVKVAETEPANA